jgi:hypothetical protein
VISFVSIVTAPFRARARPSIWTPVVTVTDVSARIEPANVEYVPSVAELPICQKTLHAWAPLIKCTRLPVAVVSVDVTWKTQMASGSPSASSVSVPVNPIDEVAL